MKVLSVRISQKPDRGSVNFRTVVSLGNRHRSQFAGAQ